MRKLPWLYLGLIFAFTGLSAASTAIVTITFIVQSVRDITFSGNPGTFTVSPGGAPAVDTSTTYSVVTNESNQRIFAALNTNMPTGLTLQVNLQAPTGATSAGAQTLSTTSVDLVTGISNANQTGLTVSYSLAATVAAATAPSATRTLTYTIGD
ncbi:MAG: hypothetical protein WC222_07930 [Parachlamydiales bacterium]|jgi:hypothetical protein